MRNNDSDACNFCNNHLCVRFVSHLCVTKKAHEQNTEHVMIKLVTG